MPIPDEKLTEGFISLIKMFLIADFKLMVKKRCESKLRDKNLLEESLLISK